jgi:hypothetical protein
MFKTYVPQPTTIQAAYIEKAGTYDIDGGDPYTVDQDDVYIVKTEDGYQETKGEFFRNRWVERQP